jgi:hypothetical protein
MAFITTTTTIITTAATITITSMIREDICKATVNARDFLGGYLDFQVQVGDLVLLAKAHPLLRTPTGDAIYA